MSTVSGSEASHASTIESWCFDERGIPRGECDECECKKYLRLQLPQKTSRKLTEYQRNRQTYGS